MNTYLRNVPANVTTRCFLLATAVAAMSLCLMSNVYAQTVQAVDWSKYSGMLGVQSGDAFGQKLVNVLQKSSRYNYSWLESNYSTTGSGSEAMYDPGWINWQYQSTHAEYKIRPLAHNAWGSAAMIKTGVFSPGVSGISLATAISRTEKTIRGAALSHRTNRSSGYWGGEWQAAEWAAQTAEGAWMLWNDLSSTTKTAVTNMVQYEANRFINYNVPYWRNPSGSTNYPGDTKAEENAWNSRILGVAQAMMPNHANVPLWRLKASELLVSAYSRPSDLTSTRLVDGVAVKDWVGGYNAYQEGFVANHDIIHPDYMVADTLCSANVITCTLANQYVPQSVFFNSDVLYDTLNNYEFVEGDSPWGTIRSPGGTMYKKSVDGETVVYDPNLYFPQGNDWGTKRYDIYLQTDVYAELQNLDAGEDYDAMGWAVAHLDALEAIQDRTGHDGNFWESGDWNDEWPPREAFAFNNVAESWTAWWLMQNDQLSPVSDHWGTVPEPSTLILLLLAVVAYAFRKTARRWC